MKYAIDSRGKCPHCERTSSIDILDVNWYDSDTTTSTVQVPVVNKYHTVYTKAGHILPSYAGKRQTIRYKNEIVQNTVDKYIVAAKCTHCSEIYTIETNSNNYKLKKHLIEKQMRENAEEAQRVLENKQEMKEQAKEELLSKYKKN